MFRECCHGRDSLPRVQLPPPSHPPPPSAAASLLYLRLATLSHPHLPTASSFPVPPIPAGYTTRGRPAPATCGGPPRYKGQQALLQMSGGLATMAWWRSTSGGRRWRCSLRHSSLLPATFCVAPCGGRLCYKGRTTLLHTSGGSATRLGRPCSMRQWALLL
jgi:hypothetical protein